MNPVPDQVPLGVRSLLQLSNERVDKIVEEAAQVLTRIPNPESVGTPKPETRSGFSVLGGGVAL